MKRLIIILYSLFFILCLSAQTLNLSNSEARRMALTTSETLKKLNNEVLKAKLDKEIAHTAYLPDFKANGSYMYLFKDNDMMGQTMQMRGMWMAGIGVTQPLYVGGKITAANKLAGIGKDVADEQLRLQQMQTISDVDNAYWNYVSVLQEITMLQGYVRQLDAVYNQVKTSVDAEMAIQNDLVRIDAKRTEMQYNLQKAQNGANLCRLALCNEIGADFNTHIVPSDTVITVQAPEQMQNDISQRPEMTMLAKGVEAKKEQIKFTRADYLPTLALMGNYFHYDGIKMKGTTQTAQGPYDYTMNMKGDFPILGATLSIPIFHFGEGAKKIKKAKLDFENAQLERQRNERLLRIELQQAIQNVTDSYNMVGTAEKSMAHAQENLRAMKNKYDNDYCTLTDLLDAESQWLSAHSNIIEAKAQYKMNVTAYQKAAGILQ